jgi:hypothetical protein
MVRPNDFVYTFFKENFIHMIEELKTAFAPHGLMLTAAVSAGKTTIGLTHFFSLQL